jgi:HPt (histidine-containing phosphotransfer) domain-containing protein
MMLKLMIEEIEKSDKNLNEFLSVNDMDNFRIEAHGIKGSLANIGAMDIAEHAYGLEIASKKEDTVFCISNLPILLEELNELKLKLKEAFFEIGQSCDIIELPPELPPILENLMNAFDCVDLALLDKEISKLNDLVISYSLEDKIEQIKDAVAMMDYENATKYINNLLNHV